MQKKEGLSLLYLKHDLFFLFFFFFFFSFFVFSPKNRQGNLHEMQKPFLRKKKTKKKKKKKKKQ